MLIGMPGKTQSQNSHLFSVFIRFDVILGVVLSRRSFTMCV